MLWFNRAHHTLQVLSLTFSLFLSGEQKISHHRDGVGRGMLYHEEPVVVIMHHFVVWQLPFDWKWRKKKGCQPKWFLFLFQCLVFECGQHTSRKWSGKRECVEKKMLPTVLVIVLYRQTIFFFLILIALNVLVKFCTSAYSQIYLVSTWI